MAFPNRKYKDTIFTALFGENKENFLSLYNALNNTNLKPEDTIIQRRIIPQTVYHTYNNDISMLVNNKLIVMIEHQSTINENIPFRFLEYVTRIYEGLVESDDRYKKKIIPLPKPEFYVFYNGLDDYPNNKILYLSDAFNKNSGEQALELKVLVKNITFSNNSKSDLKIIEGCTILKEYCQFVELVRGNGKGKRSFRKAIDTAIKNDILRDFLLENSREVMNMLCARYSYRKEMKVARQEAREDGLEEGRAEGRIKGLAEGKAEGLLEGKAEGREEGLIEGRSSVALSMKLAGESIDKIKLYTGLSEKEINLLK